MKKNLTVIFTVLLMITLAACGTINTPAASESVTSILQSEDVEKVSMGKEQITNALGALSPEDSLQYMKETANLVIVDVATTNHYNTEHFEGAIHIPIEELDSEAEDALYEEIPAGRPVLLHCRLGMIVPGAYELVLELRQDIPEIAYINGAPLFGEYNAWISEQQEQPQGQKLLGGQSPEEALEYMKNTPDLVIVEVNAPEWKLSNGIIGAMYIPYTEMAERYDEIPAECPVLLHCGGGIVSVEAYEVLQEKRPDIPELSYIAGAPPVSGYNEWQNGQ